MGSEEPVVRPATSRDLHKGRGGKARYDFWRSYMTWYTQALPMVLLLDAKE
jgi:hypothetical protein